MLLKSVIRNTLHATQTMRRVRLAVYRHFSEVGGVGDPTTTTTTTTTNNNNAKPRIKTPMFIAWEAKKAPPSTRQPRNNHLRFLEEACYTFGLKDEAPWPNPWGLAIYRCTYGEHTNEPWDKMLKLIQKEVELGLEMEDRTEDLLHLHDLVVMDDRAKFNRATTRSIRHRFLTWAADQVTEKYLTTNPEDSEYGQDWIFELREEILRNEFRSPGVHVGARYHYCLIVDDICLESLHRMKEPVVKLLMRAWKDTTLNGRELHDFGWIYLPVNRYVEMCDRLAEQKIEWTYTRRQPPFKPLLDSKSGLHYPVGWDAKEGER